MQAIFKMINPEDAKHLPDDENTPEKRAEKIWGFFGKKDDGECLLPRGLCCTVTAVSCWSHQHLAIPVPVPRGMGTPRPAMHCRAGWGLGEWTEAASPGLLPGELPLRWGRRPVPGSQGPRCRRVSGRRKLRGVEGF